MELQPNPLSAMELIANESVRMVHGRKAVCDGGMLFPL
jgi:NADH dehydrogenase (ubiquinone) Fe-S protein 6